MPVALPMGFCSRVSPYGIGIVNQEVEANHVYVRFIDQTILSSTGSQHPSRSTTSVEVIGLATATALARSVPVVVAGVVFLSGTHYPHLTSSRI